MAVLSDADAGEIRQILYQLGVGKEELKALTNIPNKTQFKNGFQVLEDFWTDGATQNKSDVETAWGTSITNALAKKVGRAFLLWKGGEGG